MKFFAALLLAVLICNSYTSRVSLNNVRRLLQSNPSIFPVPSKHGLLPLNGKEGDDIFWWFFPAKKNADKAPLILWLTGGPGCSSELAALKENGPIAMNKGVMTENMSSWNTNAHLLYIDQPVGTGFSKAKSVTDYDTNEEDIAKDIANTIDAWLRLDQFKELQGREFYITGESYAGHYLPALGHYLHTNKNPIINMRGMAIGNGLVSPINQYDAYVSFAYNNNLIGSVHKILLSGWMQICKALTYFHVPLLDVEVCNLGITSVLGLPFAPNFNTYDIREKCTVPPLCYDFSDVDALFKRDDVLAELGVSGRSWEQCNMAVHTALITDWSTDGMSKVSELVDAPENYKVLIYHGDKDYICNWEGGRDWTEKMPWSKKTDYNAMTMTKCDEGECKELRNFKFAKVADAGHMVPMNQPEVALNMMNKFIGVEA
jgi:cathepsin A (carboxypeptidase C)